MIRTESLTKFYGNRCAVRDLDLSIESREIVGFLGLNGAGKTTALRMLAGQLLPSAGKIEIDGRDMLAEGNEMRWRIGFLPERPPLYDDMTVRRYLDFAARLRGYDPSKAGARVDEVLALTSLGPYADELISALSHGYRQRVGIAQAIVHDPALVILDEPNNGLDPAQIREMRSLIRELRSRHTVLLSSHILPEISQTCDRLMIIRDGRLVAVGTEAELSAKLGEHKRVQLEVTGDGARLEETMTKLVAGGVVARFERIARDGVHDLDVSLSTEAPEEVSRAIVEAGLGLRRLAPMKSELESLFLELTHTKGD
ncbi:ABC transporter ATP-binding protein [Myxococcota bacterium]|nr:ABC transporter ATP-binding protein [Myxococcota bacterium]